MQCAHPVWIKTREGLRKEVACGNCVQCRIARSREWAVRCLNESLYWAHSSFVTLTYNDDNLPDNGSLCKDDLQKFVKRLRKSLSSDGRKIKYFASGEYGEKTHRPHYHLIVFGMEACRCAKNQNPGEMCGCVDRTEVIRAWGKGGVDRLGSVTYESIRYVADYVLKIGKTLPVDLEDVLERPMQLMSLGLGRRYCDDRKDVLIKDCGQTVHGVQVGLSRYYAKRLGIKAGAVERLFGVELSKVSNVFGGVLPESIPALADPREQREREKAALVRNFDKGSF